MTANVDAMVRAGAQAYRAGNRDEARTLLERAIEIDEYNENAWLWLSAVVENEEEQRTCLENVLVINPDNERAREGLKSLGYDPDAVTDHTAAESSDVFEEELPSTPAFTDDSFDEYQVPSSSASVTSEDALTEDDYDSWMDDLDLGETTVEEPADTGLVDEAIFDEDEFDNAFFGDDNFDDAGYDYYEDEGDFASDAPAPAIEENVEDDLYADDNMEALLAEDMADSSSASTAADSPMIGDDDDFDQFDEFDAEFDDDDYDIEDDEILQDDYSEVSNFPRFEQIPDEIEPTRLPGTDDPAPTTDYAIIGVLALANLIAVAYIVFTLFA